MSNTISSIPPSISRIDAASDSAFPRLDPGSREGAPEGSANHQSPITNHQSLIPMPASLHDKTLFIPGASRGIGKAIALRAARDGARIVVAAKTTEPHPRLPGTIHTAAADIEQAGGRALAVAVDVRDEAQVESAVHRTVDMFGGIDVLVNNASAISLTGTVEIPMKRFDL